MLKEWYRPAANGEGPIMSYCWKVDSPKGIVQFVHDQGTYAKFYRELAEYLNYKGYDVYANDLVGHGMSKQGHRGSFGMKKDSFTHLLEDVDSLFDYAADNSGRNLPRILIGIGLGSLVATGYSCDYPNLDGLILISLLKKPKMSKLVRFTANRFVKHNGYNKVSASVDSMLNQLNTIPGNPESTRYFWFSTLEDEVKAYDEDPDCGFTLTASAYREILDTFKRLDGKKGQSQIPDIPIGILAGGEDQLGDCGNAARGLSGILSAKSNHSLVDMKLYPGMYHDILHDACKGEVLANIGDWIDRNISAE